MKVLADSAVELIKFAVKGQGPLERAAASRAEHYLDAAQMIAEQLGVPHRKEALADMRRQVLHLNLARGGRDG